MPGPLVTVTTSAHCAHMGTATPMVPSAHVTILGQPAVAMTSQYTIAGCPFSTPGGPLPCVTAQFTTAATRVTSNGQPLLLVDSQAMTVPNGVPVLFIPGQTRVIAQ